MSTSFLYFIRTKLRAFKRLFCKTRKKTFNLFTHSTLWRFIEIRLPVATSRKRGKKTVVFQCAFEIKFADTANLKQIAASNLMCVFINTKYIYKDCINPCQPNSQVRVMQVALRADVNYRPTP